MSETDCDNDEEMRCGEVKHHFIRDNQPTLVNSFRSCRARVPAVPLVRYPKTWGTLSEGISDFRDSKVATSVLYHTSRLSASHANANTTARYRKIDLIRQGNARGFVSEKLFAGHSSIFPRGISTINIGAFRLTFNCEITLKLL